MSLLLSKKLFMDCRSRSWNASTCVLVSKGKIQTNKNLLDPSLCLCTYFEPEKTSQLHFPLSARCCVTTTARLKVSKSQKFFYLKLHWPKNEQNIWQNFVKYFVCFWAMELQEKCFWDLLTFTKISETTAKKKFISTSK